MSIKINSNRSASIHKFAYDHTYNGFLGGDPIKINNHIIEEVVPEWAAMKIFNRKNANELPIYVKQPQKTTTSDPRNWRFPKFVCFVLLQSSKVEGRPESEDDDVLGSRVAYCWFTDNINLPIDDLVAAGVEPFDWDKVAENWGY